MNISLLLLAAFLIHGCSHPAPAPSPIPKTSPDATFRPSPSDIVITYDEGGVVNNYANYYHQLYVGHRRVVIDGYCGSSCTLALALPNTCVTARARLGFHQAYENTIFGGKIIDAVLSSYLMSQYPPAIKKWLNDHGGLTPDIKMLEGKEMLDLVKRCGS